MWGCHVTDAGGSNKAFLQKNPFLAPGGSTLVQKLPALREHLPVLGTQLVGGTLTEPGFSPVLPSLAPVPSLGASDTQPVWTLRANAKWAPSVLSAWNAGGGVSGDDATSGKSGC